MGAMPDFLTVRRRTGAGDLRGRAGLGLARIIRRETTDGEEIAAFMLAVFRGHEREDLRMPVQPMSVRIEAAEWLARHAWAPPKDDDDAGQAGGLALQLALVLSQLPPGVVEQLQRAMLSAGQADPLYTIGAPARETTVGTATDDPQAGRIPDDDNGQPGG